MAESNQDTTKAINDRLEILEEMGRQDLIDLFKDYSPRRKRVAKKGPPLDQRVSMTVTEAERRKLDMELRTVKKNGEKISMSQFIRNRALSSVDINQWKTLASEALKEIEKTHRLEKEFEKRLKSLSVFLDDPNLDDLEAQEFEHEIWEIKKKLKKIIAQDSRRKHRLSGRMSIPESETIKWRAEKLCITSSDYLRMIIFGLTPDTVADAHLSFDAKRRFYISIINVANNGWGSSPKVYECSQCENYMEENRKIHNRVQQLELSR